MTPKHSTYSGGESVAAVRSTPDGTGALYVDPRIHERTPRGPALQAGELVVAVRDAHKSYGEVRASARTGPARPR